MKMTEGNNDTGDRRYLKISSRQEAGRNVTYYVDLENTSRAVMEITRRGETDREDVCSLDVLAQVYGIFGADSFGDIIGEATGSDQYRDTIEVRGREFEVGVVYRSFSDRQV